ncbi:YeiH family protein [Streptococcus caprae]|uniref:YeiH family protein n=1 Tax=Streptococcus caprae TaxID=1640501 RepID=A0ABV8CWJ5_9STRE
MKIKDKWLGVALCLLIAGPAWVLGHWLPLVGAPVFAILIGMVAGSFIINREKLSAGLTFTSKYVLQMAVVLLGFGLNLGQVLAVGTQSLPVILATITTALVVAYGLQRWLQFDITTATLVGVGSSICGGSAIAATAPVIEAEEEQVAQAISVIFLFNILAALLFPTLGGWLGLSNDGFALFAGTAVNDTSSVTATAAAWDTLHQSNTLDSATVVKLTRTLAIIPITLGLSLYRAKKQVGQGQGFSWKRVFPMFLLYFILASLVTTLLQRGGLNLAIFGHLKTLSKFFIVMAMAAIGFNTDPVKLVKTGGPAIFIGGVCWFAITLVSLVMQAVLGIW